MVKILSDAMLKAVQATKAAEDLIT